jgi:hypothetical protein
LIGLVLFTIFTSCFCGGVYPILASAAGAYLSNLIKH